MSVDYEPLDIFPLCNGGADLLEAGADVELGQVAMRGLPFLVGAPEGHPDSACFIALDGSGSSVTVPIGKAVRNLIVAHRVVESLDDSPGEDVAEYVFHRTDGSEERAPIRAGFQIGGTGRFPYDAYIDAKPTLMPRYGGKWSESGRRPMEALATFAKRYYLWVWRNPDPSRDVESLEIIPRGPRFIVAAVTLGYADEHPFPREGMRPARITLKSEEAAGKPFSLEVGVDRGDVTYPHPLPAMSDDEFLGDSYRGWGEQQNQSSSPAYVEVSATPSASVSLEQDGEDLGSVRWGDVDREGAAETPKAKVELIDPGRNWVRVTVLDDETGRPVPCRVHFRTPEGVPYQPYGNHNRANSNLPTDNFDIGGDVRLGQITYAYIDGTCQGWLPRGDVIADVARGFEYDPLRTKVRIEPGQRELTLRIKRWSNMNAEGWYSGDSHVHFLSSQGAVTEAAGEDLNVVNLLQSQWGSLFTNTEDFIGAPNVARSGDTIVYVSQENRQHVMGHLILWGLKEPVMPWCTDGPGEAELAGTMEMTLSQWADACHEQGGTVIAPHIGNFSGELVALTATGRVQGMEMIRMHENAHDGYYRALNCGYRMPLVGGTDKMSGGRHSRPLAHLRPPTRRPGLQLRQLVQGRGQRGDVPVERADDPAVGGRPGDRRYGRAIGARHGGSGGGGGEYFSAAQARHRSGRPRRGIYRVGGGARRLTIRERITVTGHTWIAARCGGPSYFTDGNFNSGFPPSWSLKDHSGLIADTHYDAWRRGIFAHTSPVYVACGGDWWMFDEATARHMLTVLDGSMRYIEGGSLQHRHGTVTHHHGEDDHIAYLKRPFLEAQELVEERLRRMR